MGDEKAIPELTAEEKQALAEIIKPKTPKSIILYNLLKDWAVEVFRDADTSEWLCRYTNDGLYQIEGLYGENFLSWALSKFYDATGKTISSATAKEAFLLLQAQSFETRKTFIRVGEHCGRTYIDLCNDAYEAIEIDCSGWRIVQDPPVMFRRSRYSKILPYPREGGSIETLKTLGNFASEADYILTAGWLVTSLNPYGPFPILALSSEHGSGKSTLMTLLQRIIDPQATERLSPFKDIDGLFSAAAGRWVVPLDNCGKINIEMSDNFCRLATGGGLSKRQLFTDNESFSVSVVRPLALNGIALSLGRMDLLDRSYCVGLSPIKIRKTEGEIYDNFERIQPLLLGALCTAVSAALREKDYRPDRLPRMADGAAFILRAEKGGGLPWSVGTFASTLEKREALKIEVALLEDPTGAALLHLMRGDDGRNEFVGTASDLLRVLVFETREEERMYLPKLPRWLSTRLEELAPFLRAKGIVVRNEPRKTDQRLIRITKILAS